jgi:hypothetical protein
VRHAPEEIGVAGEPPVAQRALVDHVGAGAHRLEGPGDRGVGAFRSDAHVGDLRAGRQEVGEVGLLVRLPLALDEPGLLLVVGAFERLLERPQIECREVRALAEVDEVGGGELGPVAGRTHGIRRERLVARGAAWEEEIGARPERPVAPAH